MQALLNVARVWRTWGLSGATVRVSVLSGFRDESAVSGSNMHTAVGLRTASHACVMNEAVIGRPKVVRNTKCVGRVLFGTRWCVTLPGRARSERGMTKRHSSAARTRPACSGADRIGRNLDMCDCVEKR